MNHTLKIKTHKICQPDMNIILYCSIRKHPESLRELTLFWGCDVLILLKWH